MDYRKTFQPQHRLEGVTRRGFIKTGMTVALGTAACSIAAPMTGYASDEALQPEKQSKLYPGTQDATVDAMLPVEPPDAWDYEADVVIVGGGGSGLSALVTCAEQGFDVLVVEKNAFTGGDTQMAIAIGGNVGSRFQQSCGMPVLSTAQQIWDEQLGAPNPQSPRNPVLTRKIIDASAATCDWLESVGVVFSPEAPGGMSLGALVPIDPDKQDAGWNYWWPHNARGYTEALAKRSLDYQNATILLEHPAFGLVAENDEIVGVACKNPGNDTVFVKGKKIMLCTGGFASNRAMLDEHYPGNAAQAVRSWGLPSAMGEGIRMAQGVGAAVANLHEIEVWDGGVKRELGAHGVYTAANQLVRQKSLTVNKLAKRFFCESKYAGHLYSYQAAMNIHQPEATSFTLFDANCISKGDIIKKFKPRLCEYPVPWFEEQFKESLDDGTIMKADSIEELAVLMEVDEGQLQKTVNRYNELSDKGADEDFFKEAEYLQPIRTAPFYAVKQVGGSAFNTWGGLVADEDFRVVDDAGQPIKNLFVAGETGAGLANVRYALVGGRLSAQSVISELSSQ